jgi:hypothetical protein
MLYKWTWNSHYTIFTSDLISNDLIIVDVYFIYKWHEAQFFVTAAWRRPTVSAPDMCEVLMEWWLVRENQTPEESLPQCPIVYHTSCTNSTGIECSICSEKPVSNHLSYNMASRSFYEYKLWSNLIMPYSWDLL